MKELEKSRYFESVLSGTHMLIESMDVKELHSSYKVVADLQQKIVTQILVARITHSESNKINSPSGSNSIFGSSLSPRSVRNKDITTPVIQSVNTSRLSLDNRKIATPREGESSMAKKRYSSVMPSATNGGLLWVMNSFLLPNPDTVLSPDPEVANDLTRQGYGLASTSTNDRRLLVNTTWSAEELNAQLARRYPRVPNLIRIGFTFWYRPSGSSRHLVPITSKLPYDLYSLLGNEGILYLKPKLPLKASPLRQGPQETICIDDDDEDASIPTPISTGRRQQPNTSPGLGRGLMNNLPSGSVANSILQSPQQQPVTHHSPQHSQPQTVSAGQVLRGQPTVAMPPPQMVPGVRVSAATSGSNTVIPLPHMSTSAAVSAAIQLPVPLQANSSSAALAALGQPGIVVHSHAMQNPISTMAVSPVISGPSTANRMHITQSNRPQQHAMEVLKIPVESPAQPPPIVRPPSAETDSSSRGEPPEKRPALAQNPVPIRRLSNPATNPPESEAPQPNNPPNNAANKSNTEILNKMRTCMLPENEEFLRQIIRQAMLIQGPFFSARSLVRTLAQGVKRPAFSDTHLNTIMMRVLRLMADENLGSVHLEVGAKNARDTGFIKAWPVSPERLKRYNIPEVSYAQTLLMAPNLVPSTVDRDLTTLAAAADWPKRKQNVIEFLQSHGVTAASAPASLPSEDQGNSASKTNGAPK